jgi:hypothetical protein
MSAASSPALVVNQLRGPLPVALSAMTTIPIDLPCR